MEIVAEIFILSIMVPIVIGYAFLLCWPFTLLGWAGFHYLGQMLNARRIEFKVIQLQMPSLSLIPQVEVEENPSLISSPQRLIVKSALYIYPQKPSSFSSETY